MIEAWHGIEYISVYPDGRRSIGLETLRRAEQGYVRFKEIPRKDALLDLDLIKRLHLQAVREQKEPEQTKAPEPPKDAPLRMKRREFLAVLDRIIRESKAEGEIANARDAWRKVCGKDWPQA